MNIRKLKTFLLGFPSDIVNFAEEEKETLKGKFKILTRTLFLGALGAVGIVILLEAIESGEVGIAEKIAIAFYGISILYHSLLKVDESVYVSLVRKNEAFSEQTKKTLFRYSAAYKIIAITTYLGLPTIIGSMIEAENGTFEHLTISFVVLIYFVNQICLNVLLEKIRYGALAQENLPMLKEVNGFDHIEDINEIISRRNMFHPEEDFSRLKEKIEQANQYLSVYKKSAPYIQLQMFDETSLLLDGLYNDLFNISFYEEEIGQLKRKATRIAEM